MSLQLSNVSKRLKSKQQWICWRTTMRDGKETKLPVDPNTNQMAKTDDPSTWGSVMDSVRAFQSNKQLKGIGFVFTENDPFVGIDLDDCRDPESEEWDDWALSILQDVDGFREISPSGTGGHIITIGEIPGDRNRKGSVEMYESTRYFTVTGDIISEDGERTDEVPEIQESQNGINAVYDQFLVDEDSDSATDTEVDVHLSGLDHLELENHGNGPSGTYTSGANLESLPEEEQKIVKTAKGSKNGYKFTQLWHGNWKQVYPGESHSEADMGFCDMLAFWCSGDPERIDRVFRASGLIRPKWDEQRYSDGSTYGERTIQRAIAKVDDYYDPDHFDNIATENSNDTGNEDDGREGSAEEENESSEANGGDSDGFSDDQETPPAEDDESESDSSDDQSEFVDETGSDKENAPKRRSRRSRSNSTVFAESKDATSESSKEEQTEEDDSTATSSNQNINPSGNAEENKSNASSRDNKTTDDGLKTINGTRRSRSGQNRIDSSSEFDPVNVSSSSSETTEDGTPTKSENDSGTPTPVEDGDSFFDREFDDDGFLDDALENSDEESTLGIDREEAKGIYDDDDDKEPTSDSEPGQSTPDLTPQERDSDEASFDSRMSANGNRKIPGVLDAKLHDIASEVDRLREIVTDLETKHDNDIAQQEDKIQLLRKEIAFYENLVDQQEHKINQLSQVVLLLCQHHPEPLFDRVEQALLDGEEIPVEDIVEPSQQPRWESSADGRDSDTSSEWVEQSQRSRTKKKKKTSDLDEEGVAPEEGKDDDENIRDHLSRFF
jgi:primase-polymerase (primpol)-like protein